jgi:hypothetical protein
MLPKDENWVRDSYRRCITQATGLLPDHTYLGISRFLDRILSNPKTKVLIAADAEDDQEILGYAMTTNDVLHWILVKKDYRKAGVASALLADLPTPLRVWYPSEKLKALSRIAGLVVDPLALLDC